LFAKGLGDITGEPVEHRVAKDQNHRLLTFGSANLLAKLVEASAHDDALSADLGRDMTEHAVGPQDHLRRGDATIDGRRESLESVVANTNDGKFRHELRLPVK